MTRQVTVADMAQSREARADKQRALLSSHPGTLVCLCLNIAGPIKQNALINQGFSHALTQIKDLLDAHHMPVIHSEEKRAHTGPEAFVLVSAEPLDVKRLMVGLEDRDRFGRLLDIDVIRPDGTKVARQDIGQPARQCLICGEPVAHCAPSRRHSAEDLYATAMGIIKDKLDSLFVEEVGALATRALLTELSATPKPGLVDRANNGAHRDMDFFSFVDSASALTGYFSDCARRGLEASSPGACFLQLRLEGALAEGKMRRATGGVNTHKGAIFVIGILSAAAGLLQAKGLAITPDTLAALSQQMTENALKNEMNSLPHARTFGEGLRPGQLSGARLEAALGFPTVFGEALPALNKALDGGMSLNDACCHTLLVIMASAEDSVLIKRAGQEAAKDIQEKARQLALTGCPHDALAAFDRACIASHISAGGSADLLAAALFVRFLISSDRSQSIA